MTEYVCDICGWTVHEDELPKNVDPYCFMATHLRTEHVQVSYYNNYETDTAHFHLVLPSKEDVEQEKRRA